MLEASTRTNGDFLLVKLCNTMYNEFKNKTYQNYFQMADNYYDTE